MSTCEYGNPKNPSNPPGSPAESKRARLVPLLLSRPVGAVAAAILILIFLGCMSLSIGCRSEPDGAVCQKGKLSLRDGQEVDVYYPAPYASPPNLELHGDCDKCEVLDQKADHFRIRCNDPLDATPRWQARGLRCYTPAIPPPVVVAPPAAPPPPSNGAPVPLPAPTPVQNP